MKTIGKSACYALSVTALCFAGCAGSQTASLLPQTSAARNAPLSVGRTNGGSWMSPQAKNDDLVYVTNTGSNSVTVYSVGTHKLEGMLTGINQPYGLCSDTQGNVWVVGWGKNQMIKYAHAGTQALETLTVKDPNADLYDCAVDPTTGDLAVTNWGPHNWYHGDVLIYPHGQGSPKTYVGAAVWFYFGCTYDDKGNLFVDGWDAYLNGYVGLGVLPKGGKSFQRINLIPSMQPPMLGTVRWDGKYVAIGDWEWVNEYVVKGSYAYLHGITNLTNHWPVGMFWIGVLNGKNVIIAPDTAQSPNDVQYWNYPNGGVPTATIHQMLDGSFGATVSMAQH